MQAIATDPAEPDAVSAWMFLRSFRASRLFAPADVDLLERQIEEVGLAAATARLVDDGVLTPYQLKRISSGMPTGLVFGQYRVLDELGQGGFGRVFKAYHALMDRVVALKVIAPHRSQDRFARDLFLREMTAGTRLAHPNIAMVYDANEVDGELFFAMEYVDGTSLEQRVMDRGPLPVEVVRAVLVQSARALQAAHDSGLVHRDIKPANLLLSRAAAAGSDIAPAALAVKVVDFGLARLSAPAAGRPSTTILCGEGAIVGTPEFMSPEQARDVHTVDGRSDLYSLGCTAYFALTGRPPFVEATAQATCLLHFTQDAPPVQSLRPDTPPDLAAAIGRLMSKGAADRYQTAGDLITALTAAPADQPADGPPRPLAPPAPAGRSSCDTAAPDHTLPVLLSLEPSPTAAPPGAVAGPSDGPLPVGDLHALWASWYDMVVRTGRRGRHGVREGDYKSVHRALVRSVKSAAGHAAAPPDRLLSVVEPWVSLGALCGLDRRTHAALCEACGELDGALKPDRGPRALPLVVAAVACCVLLLLALFLFPGTLG